MVALWHVLLNREWFSKVNQVVASIWASNLSWYTFKYESKHDCRHCLYTRCGVTLEPMQP
jgi:hypothetical protein